MRQSRVDANQSAIVQALRAVGATVQPLHMVRGGCPDLLVGHRGVNHILECKDGKKPPSARKLTRDEAMWLSAWRGRAVVVDSVEQALDAIGV